MEEKLNQIDLEDLSAYMDGELTDPSLSRVKDLLRTSPAWKRALEQLQAVDRAMEAYITPPAPADLARKVLAKVALVHRPALIRPSFRWMIPLTAAAAAVIVLMLAGAIQRPARHRGASGNPVVRTVTPPPGGQVNTTAQEPQEDEDYYPEVAGENFVEDHLEFFRDMSVVNDLDTIEAIYNQQKQSEGT